MKLISKSLLSLSLGLSFSHFAYASCPGASEINKQADTFFAASELDAAAIFDYLDTQYEACLSDSDAINALESLELSLRIEQRLPVFSKQSQKVDRADLSNEAKIEVVLKSVRTLQFQMDGLDVRIRQAVHVRETQKDKWNTFVAELSKEVSDLESKVDSIHETMGFDSAKNKLDSVLDQYTLISSSLPLTSLVNVFIKSMGYTEDASGKGALELNGVEVISESNGKLLKGKLTSAFREAVDSLEKSLRSSLEK